MGLSYEEQETVSTYNRASKQMTVYTANPYEMERFSKSPLYRLVKEYKQDGKVVAMEFVSEKRFCHFRTYDRKKNA